MLLRYGGAQVPLVARHLHDDIVSYMHPAAPASLVRAAGADAAMPPLFRCEPRADGTYRLAGEIQLDNGETHSLAWTTSLAELGDELGEHVALDDSTALVVRFSRVPGRATIVADYLRIDRDLAAVCASLPHEGDAAAMYEAADAHARARAHVEERLIGVARAVSRAAVAARRGVAKAGGAAKRSVKRAGKAVKRNVNKSGRARNAQRMRAKGRSARGTAQHRYGQVKDKARSGRGSVSRSYAAQKKKNNERRAAGQDKRKARTDAKAKTAAEARTKARADRARGKGKPLPPVPKKAPAKKAAGKKAASKAAGKKAAPKAAAKAAPKAAGGAGGLPLPVPGGGAPGGAPGADPGGAAPPDAGDGGGGGGGGAAMGPVLLPSDSAQNVPERDPFAHIVYAPPGTQPLEAPPTVFADPNAPADEEGGEEDEGEEAIGDELGYDDEEEELIDGEWWAFDDDDDDEDALIGDGYYEEEEDDDEEDDDYDPLLGTMLVADVATYASRLVDDERLHTQTCAAIAAIATTECADAWRVYAADLAALLVLNNA